MRFCLVFASSSGVFLGTGCASFGVVAAFAYMAVFLAFVASYRFLQVFGDNNSRVRDEDAFCKEFVSGFGCCADYLNVCCHLIWGSILRFLDPGGGHD